MGGWRVHEIERSGRETPDDVVWSTREEADEERYTLDRVARLYWPDLGFRYEVREEER